MIGLAGWLATGCLFKNGGAATKSHVVSTTNSNSIRSIKTAHRGGRAPHSHNMIEKMDTAGNETKVNRDVTIPERNRGFIAQERLGRRSGHRRLAVVKATTPEIELR